MTITNLPAAVKSLREIVGRMTQGEWFLAGKLTVRFKPDGWIAKCMWNRAHDAAGIVALRNNAMPIIEALTAENATLRAELDEQARVNGMGGEREAGHLARIAELEAALHAIASPDVLQSYGDPTVLRDYARAALGGNHE